MPCAHYLLRLSFATVRRAPKRPLIAGADSIERVPEFGRDAGIRWILHHTHALAILDLPPDFASELEIISTIIDGPGAIRLHEESSISRRNQLLKAERFLAGKQADIGHANHRQTIPALGPQRASGAAFTNSVRSLS